MRAITRLGIGLFALLWVAGAAVETEPELKVARQAFLDALEKIVTERTDQFQALHDKYLKELEEFRKVQTAQGGLDNVVAAREEIKRVSNWGELTEDERRQLPAGLQSLRRQYDTGLKRVIEDGLAKSTQLRQGYARDLEVLQRRLTQLDRIDAAMLVKQERTETLEILNLEKSVATVAAPVSTVTGGPGTPPARAMPNHGPARKIVVRTLIDGSDALLVRGMRIWFEHRDGVTPGRGNNQNEPTLINGLKWQPVWFSHQSRPYDRLVVSLPSMALPDIQVNQIAGRGSVTVLMRPSRDNVYTLSVLIKDSDPGADWYELEITW